MTNEKTGHDVAVNEQARKSPFNITRADVLRYSYMKAINESLGLRNSMFDMRTSWGKEMSRRVKTYLSFHKREVETMVELHRQRARKNKLVVTLDLQWKSNVLSNHIYLDYKRSLMENRFGHLRVRHNMLSVDCRNHHAVTPIDFRVLAILKNRRVDNVEGKWY